jgi:hypothetical protein
MPFLPPSNNELPPSIHRFKQNKPTHLPQELKKGPCEERDRLSFDFLVALVVGWSSRSRRSRSLRRSVDLVLPTYKAGRLPHWVLEVPFLEVLLPSSQCKHSKLLLEAGVLLFLNEMQGKQGYVAMVWVVPSVGTFAWVMIYGRNLVRGKYFFKNCSLQKQNL